MALAKFFCQAMALLFFKEEKSINKIKKKRLMKHLCKKGILEKSYTNEMNIIRVFLKPHIFKTFFCADICVCKFPAPPGKFKQYSIPF